MSEEPTQPIPPEEQFRQILSELRTLNERISSLEAKSYDTRPIWERALAEISGVRQELTAFKQEMTALKQEVSDGFRRLRRDLYTLAE